MKTLKITLSLSPSRGPSIPKQTCHYFKTDRGLPAIQVRWETLFKKYEETFVFQTQATLVYPIGPKGAKFAYKFNTGPSLSVLGMASGGIVGGVIGFASELALGAAKTAPQGLDGIGVNYRNDKGENGIIEIVGGAEIIAEILSSIPSERIHLR